MDIRVPTEDEYHKDRKSRIKNLIYGLFFGIIFCLLTGYKLFTYVFFYGFGKVEWYSWAAMGITISLFGWMAYRFGGSFWALFKS